MKIKVGAAAKQDFGDLGAESQCNVASCPFAEMKPRWENQVARSYNKIGKTIYVIKVWPLMSQVDDLNPHKF